MARYRLLAGSCNAGPCPNFYVDDTTGDVKVQGYVTTLLTEPIPEGEDVVHIPARDWATLLSRLPLRMLLRAVVAKPAVFRPRTPTALSVPSGR